MAKDDTPQRVILQTEDDLESWERRPEISSTHVDAETGQSKTIANRVQLTLRGEAAMTLWRKGSSAWNAWVEENPEADVDFSGQKFVAVGADDTEQQNIDFRSLRFPKGTLSFERAEFHGGKTTFQGTDFDDGDVSFCDVKFIDCSVNFRKARFGDGDVDFTGAEFKKGPVHFSKALFGNGYKTFVNINFGSENVYFNNVNFGTGLLSFALVRFPQSVDFSNSDFDSLEFESVTFVKGGVKFDFSNFKNPALFRLLRGLKAIRRFSFEGVTFERLLTFISEDEMGSPLDLRRTKMAHPPVLHDLYCDFGRTPRPDWTSRISSWLIAYPSGENPSWDWRNVASDREDSQRFRRLKEIANTNRNHAKALDFHIQEMRSKRGIETTGWESVVQFFFWLFGNYGRSAQRPLMWLFGVWGAFAAIYWWTRIDFADFSAEAFDQILGQTRDLGTAFGYSGSNMLAFIPTGRTARTQAIELLYGGQVPDSVLLLAGVQSILSAILIFLLGLGLRNMFRV